MLDKGQGEDKYYWTDQIIFYWIPSKTVTLS